MPSSIYLLSDATQDVNFLYRALRAYAIRNKDKIKSLDPTISISIDGASLMDTYERIHVILSLCGESANACKKASTAMLAICIHAPIVSALSGGSTEQERLLQVINASAAFEIAEVMARNAQHDHSDSTKWKFDKRALFPSNHTYLDFIRNLIRFRTTQWINASDDQFEVTIYKTSMILELLFYRTNPHIAGCNNQDVSDNLLDAYKYMDFSRNCSSPTT